MITVHLTEEEIVEIANHTAFTAYHSLEDDDDEAWRVARVSLSIIDKLERAYPDLFKQEGLLCGREILHLRKRVSENAP